MKKSICFDRSVYYCMKTQNSLPPPPPHKFIAYKTSFPGKRLGDLAQRKVNFGEKKITENFLNSITNRTTDDRKTERETRTLRKLESENFHSVHKSARDSNLV